MARPRPSPRPGAGPAPLPSPGPGSALSPPRSRPGPRPSPPPRSRPGPRPVSRQRGAPRAVPAGPARALPLWLRSRPAVRMSANISGSSNMAAGGNRRLQQTQHQVDEVVDIMRVNVDKVLERDQKLSELDDRADALQAGASQFETSAAKLKRKYWWKNCKLLPKVGVIFGE
ncbi:vesicle-associated membrane protein 3 isoform 2-T2 [Cyanocitta cristata]